VRTPLTTLSTPLTPASTQRRITIVSASVGAGHDGAAGELARRLRDRGFTVDRHDFLDLVPAALGRGLRETYALQLRVAPGSWGRLLGALERHRPLAAAAAGLTRPAARRIRRALLPDTAAIVSTYPLASQALGGLRRRGLFDVPVVTYLTDMSVHPLWVAEGVDAHLALHPVAAAQAERYGAAGIRVAGPAVPPAFRPADSVLEQATARLRFGLPGGRPLALVVAGSWGVGEVEETARDVAATGLAVPVVVCGRNTALRDAITQEGTGIALGWVDDMPTLMRACQVVVQNAGGLSSLEAIAAGLPVISYRCLPGHGSTNAAALDQAGWAPWARQPAELADSLRTAQAIPPAQEAVTEDPAAFIAAIALQGAVPPALSTGQAPWEQALAVAGGAL
jgi:UDP-N-acetylglucosamine:LPS N-acetylglucosamine transferase